MLSSLVLALAFTGTAPEATERPSYLFPRETGPHRCVQQPGRRYHPRPGDLLLFDHRNKWITLAYRYCGTSAPTHAGIVFRHRDGSLAVLEAGTHGIWNVFIFDLDERLHQADDTILVRQLKTPMTAEQSNQLTEFSHEQEGKKYALGRLILQATPFRPQGTLRCHLFGRTVLDRERWMCSELVVAAMAAAGVIDPDAYPANAMYPRDLCYDERHDLSAFYEVPALWKSGERLDHIDMGSAVRAGDECRLRLSVGIAPRER